MPTEPNNLRALFNACFFRLALAAEIEPVLSNSKASQLGLNLQEFLRLNNKQTNPKLIKQSSVNIDKKKAYRLNKMNAF